MAWVNFIIPEFTKPMTITVAALDVCTAQVTAVPSRKPFSGVLVSLYRIISILLPATFFSPSDMEDIPNRNRATPVSRLSTIETFSSIKELLFFTFLRSIFFIVSSRTLPDNRKKPKIRLQSPFRDHLSRIFGLLHGIADCRT